MTDAVPTPCCPGRMAVEEASVLGALRLPPLPIQSLVSREILALFAETDEQELVIRLPTLRFLH